jgi:methionyl-tRNA formyltransferase
VISQCRIVFFGSPDFATPSLKVLAAHFEVVGVVTQPDRPAGRRGKVRPPAVKIAALELDIPIIQPEKVRTPEAMEQLRLWAPDLIVVAAFGQILRQDVLDMPGFGCLNVHGSILPCWRGAAPIQAAILAGDVETGITIMKMDAGVDTGPILSQRHIPISHEDTAGLLFQKLAPIGADLLLETIPRYLAGELFPRPQPDEGVTYAPMLKKEDGMLNFNQTAVAMERKVRAFDPWPGTFFTWKDMPLKVLKTHIRDIKSPGIGKRLVIEGLPAVGTSEGILLLEQVQPAGKKPMTGKAFLAGARDW